MVVSSIMDKKTRKEFRKRDDSWIRYPNKEYEFRETRDKLFQCYNNALKPHRLAIYTFFIKNNLTDKVDLSLLDHNSFIFDEPDWEKNFFKDVLDDSMQKEWVDIASESIKNEISLKSEFEKHNIDSKTGKKIYFGPLHEIAIDQNLYKHGCINIMTESQYEWKNIIHITEKSIVPFFFHQMPIIIAPPNHIQAMRDRWDLDFFDDIINHGYDSIEDHKLRFQRTTKEIIRLSKRETEIREFIKNNKNRFEKNKEVIRKIQHSKENENFWRSLTYIQ